MGRYIIHYLLLSLRTKYNEVWQSSFQKNKTLDRFILRDDTPSDSSAVSMNTFSDIGIAPLSRILSIIVNSSRPMGYFSHSFSRTVESSAAGRENSREIRSSSRSISSRDMPLTWMNWILNVYDIRSSGDMRNILSFRHYSYQVLLFLSMNAPSLKDTRKWVFHLILSRRK